MRTTAEGSARAVSREAESREAAWTNVAHPRPEGTRRGGGWGARPLAVHRHGAGRPAVYLHGLGGSHRYFEALWGVLPPHQVIAPDLLGFGRSPKPRRCAYRLADHLDALQPLVPPGALLVGHSAGATLALALVARPEVALRGLVLLGLPVFSGADEAVSSLAGLGFLARPTAEGRRSAHAACAVVCLSRPLWRCAAPHLVHDLPAGVVADTFSHIWRSYSSTLRNVVIEHRVTGDLDLLRAPLLVIHGAGDRSAPLLPLRRLLATRPGARLAVEAGDHHLAVRRPEAVAQHLAPLVAPPGGVCALREAVR